MSGPDNKSHSISTPSANLQRSHASLWWVHWCGATSFQETGRSEGGSSSSGEPTYQSTAVVNRSSLSVPEEAEESDSVGVC